MDTTDKTGMPVGSTRTQFTKLLREKLRSQRGAPSRAMVNQTPQEELRQMAKRNAEVKKSYQLAKLGAILDATNFEEEASLIKRMRLANKEQHKNLVNLYDQFAKQSLHLEKPNNLALDYVLGRVLKFCLYKSGTTKSLEPSILDKDYYSFSQMLDSFGAKNRKENRLESLMETCNQINSLRKVIQDSEQELDILEKKGFSFNNQTFDDIFVKGFRELNDISTDSSDEEDNDNQAHDSQNQNSQSNNQEEEIKEEQIVESQNLQEAAQESSSEEEEQFDINSIDPSRVNWFKYIMDKYLKVTAETSLALNSADAYANLLQIVLSKKQNEEIQEELLDLVGFDNFELLEKLIDKRDYIREYCKSMEDSMKQERQQDYRPKDFGSMYTPNSVVIQKGVPTNKKGKKGKQAVAVYENQRVSNYDLLHKLGFNSSLIDENKKLGMKERNSTQDMLKNYVAQHNEERKKAQVFERPQEAMKGFTTKTEDNQDYKWVEVTPPEKTPIDKSGLVAVTKLPGFAQKAFTKSGATHLNQIQSIVYPVAFKQSRNLLVAAPTGAGKTNIALLTILREVHQHVDEADQSKDCLDLSKKEFKIIYIAPLKALAAEIVGKFSQAFNYLKLRVRELTGDMSLTKQEIQETHIIVTTPEKWDVVTRKTDGMMDLVNVMIIDEIHLLNDERGLVLECLVSRAITTGMKNQKPIRMLGLSATLPNYVDVAEFINCDKEGTFCFDSSYRPTPLKCSFYGVKEMGSAARANNIFNDIIYENLLRMLQAEKQVIIFCHKRAETYSTANELVEILKDRGSRDAHLFDCENSHKRQLDINKSRNDQIKELFQYGFSTHHAGMLRKDRNLVEELFKEGNIKVLVSTSTLAWGVNLPAYGVMIKGTKVYDSSTSSYKDIGVFDVQQIFGRAGRPQYDDKGEAIILTLFKQMDDYVKMMQNKQTVESHLDKGLDNCINAEIAAGTITTITEGVQWLKKSYFYQRLIKNPQHYNVKVTEIQADPSGHFVLLQKITDCVERLNRMHLIRFNRQSEQVFSTDMGRIASNYYINCKTMSYFMINLKNVSREEMILTHLAAASEFEQLEARKEEYEELKILCANPQFVEIDKKSYNEAGTKVQILFECYLRQRGLKTFSLISDMAYIVQNSARLLRAMFEIAMNKNYATLAKQTLAWCIILDKRLEPDAHVMKQFSVDCSVGKLTNPNNKVTHYGYLKEDIIYRCRQYNLSMEDIYDRKLDEASRFIGKMSDELYKFASYVPYLELDVSCQPITRTILKVQLTIEARFTWNDRWNGKSEPFWVIIDNETEILHSEYIQIQKKDIRSGPAKGFKNDDELSLTFFIPYQVPEGQERIPESTYYSLTLISDRWHRVEFFYELNLSNLAVPDEDYPHTKLLNLRPMAVKALNDEKFEALYTKFKYFNPVQTQVFFTLYQTDSNVLIGAPTGSGKTIMSELSMLRVFKHYPDKKIIYIAPLKALAKERLADWKQRLGEGGLQKKVVELTGDFTPDIKALQQSHVLITTPEKWDGISRNWQHRSYVAAVSLVVIDEIHLLGADRGPVIEVIVSRMRYISEQTGNSVRFVGLSTALANAKDVGDWLGIHKLGLFNFKPSVRPVPIKVHFDGFAEKHYCPRMATMNRPAFKSIMSHSQDNPVLVFVSSRRQTRLTALDLLALSAAHQQEQLANSKDQFDFKKPFLHMNHEEIHAISEFIKDENLKHTIQFGVGMHHAGLAESDRKICEDLFVQKKIQVLVTTSTLAWGVNFPARLVIVKGTEFFDPKQKRYVDLPLTDLLQMIGRAGRPGFDKHGVACVFVSEEKKNFYKKFLYEPFPVESSLASQLTDHLNAEIASGTLSKKQHCIDYLTWTYFFRRLTKNPAYYKLDANNADAINQYLSNLVETTIFQLKRDNCVEYDQDDETVRPTQFGYLCSYYYLSHKTMARMVSSLTRDVGIEQLIDLLAHAEEFAGLPVRHNEEILNEAMIHLVPLPVNKHDLESPHVKANLLLQAHLERAPLPISDYVTDTKSVLDQSIRVTQGMIDVSAHKGYLKTTLNLINLLQMIIQGQWLDQSPLLNVPNFTYQTIRKLAQSGIFYLPQLIDASKTDLKAFFDRTIGPNRFSMQELKEIYKALEKVPQVEMKYNIVKVNELNEPQIGESLEEGGEAMLSVNLKRSNRCSNQDVKILNFPKSKDASWFIIVANPAKDEILGMTRANFKRFASKNITLVLPQDFLDETLEIHLLCDSYIGMDQVYTIDLIQVNGIVQGRQESIKQQKQQKKAQAKRNKMNETAITETSDELKQAQEISEAQLTPKEQIVEPKKENNKPKLDKETFLTYKEIQRNIINDILSDDEDPMTDIMDDKQGKQISQNLNSLLDSSDDDDQQNYSDEDNTQFSIFDLNKF